LVEAKIEIVECGFVNQKKGTGINSTLFKDLDQVNELITSLDIDITKTRFCVMFNKGDYDLNTLPIYNAKTDGISGIRYAFHKKDWEEAIEDEKIIAEKGYQVYVQAMVTMSYSDFELLQMLKEVNKLDIYAMYIVDSFGAMFGDDFRRLHYLFENNLREGIRLGYHSHNNLQLAYSNAIDFIQIKDMNREIILDSSIHGMGRGAGNLTTELLADYLNKKKQADYNTTPLLETIDKYLEVIYNENYWGYSIAHFLSASFECHPNYASFLVNTKTLSIVDMQKILALLNNGERTNFSKSRIEELYIGYKSKVGLKINLESNCFKDLEVLIIASGPNSENQKEIVIEHINSKNPTIIAVNHIPISFKPDYYFFSNQKRFDKFRTLLDNENVIITTNIHVDSNTDSYKVVDYHSLVIMTTNNNYNVTILLLNLLINQKAKTICLAGFDGYHFGSKNYSYEETDRILERKELEKQNSMISESIAEIRKKTKLNFLTNSIFQTNG